MASKKSAKKSSARKTSSISAQEKSKIDSRQLKIPFSGPKNPNGLSSMALLSLLKERAKVEPINKLILIKLEEELQRLPFEIRRKDLNKQRVLFDKEQEKRLLAVQKEHEDFQEEQEARELDFSSAMDDLLDQIDFDEAEAMERWHDERLEESE